VNTTISPQIKILAAVGVLAAVGLGASLFLLGHGTKKTADRVATTHSTPAPSRPAQSTPAPTTKRAHSTPATATPAVKHVTKPHTVARAHAKQAKPATFHGNRVYANLPQPLQWQLAHHKVVVVSLYNPSADVDAISVAEAHAGAVDAGAGFLLVNVLDNKVAGILTALLPGGGLLPDPGVLVYRAPGDLAIRLDGFADRDSVAQAAANASAGETGPAASAAAAPATTPTP
jgi:hypothetical protein